MSKAYSITAQLRVVAQTKDVLAIKKQIESALGNITIGISAKQLKPIVQHLQAGARSGHNFAGAMAEVSAEGRNFSRATKDIARSVSSMTSSMGGGKLKAARELNKILTTLPTNLSNMAASNGGGKAASLLAQINTGMKQTTASTNGLNKSLIASTSASDGVIAGWGRMISSSLLLYAGITKINQAVSDNIDLQNKLVNLAQIRAVSLFDPGVQGLEKQARSQGKKIGSNPNDVLASLGVVQQAGVPVNEGLVKLISEASLSAQISDVKELGTAYVVATRAMGINESTARQWLNTNLEIAKTTSATFSDILNASTILGSQVTNLGGDYRTLGLLVGETMTKSSRGYSEVSRMISTWLTRTTTLQRLQDELRDKYSLSMFEFKDGRNQFIGIEKALVAQKRLMDSLGGPNTEPGAQLSEILFGTRRTALGSSLLNSAETISARKPGLASPTDHLKRDAEIQQQSISNILMKVRRDFTDTFDEIAKTNSLKSIATSLLAITTTTLGLVRAMKELVPLFAIFALGKIKQPLKNLPYLGNTGRELSSPFKGPGLQRTPIPTMGNTPLQGRVQFSKNLINYYKEQLSAGKKVVNVQKTETIARQKAINVVAKSTKIWSDNNGAIRAVGRMAYGKQVASSAIGGAFGSVGLGGGLGIATAGLSMFGNQENEAVKAATQTLTASFLAVSLGAGKAGGALVGMVSAIIAFGKASEESRKKVIAERLSTASGKFDTAQQRSGGTLDRDSRMAFLNQAKELTGAYKNAGQDDRGFIMRSLSATGRFLTGNGTSDYEGTQFTEDRKTAVENIRQKLPQLQAMAKQVAAETGSVEEFKRDAVGKNIYKLMTILDFASQTTGKFDIELENLYKGVEETADIIRKTAVSLQPFINSITSVGAGYRNATPQSLRSSNSSGDAYLNSYSGLNQIGSVGFGRDAGQLPSTFNRPMLHQINRMAAMLPKMLTGKEFGTDFVDVIGAELSSAGFSPNLVSVMTDQLKETGFDEFSRSLKDINSLSGTLIQSGFGPLITATQQSAEALVDFNKVQYDQIDTLESQRKNSAESNTNLFKVRQGIAQALSTWANKGTVASGDTEARGEAFTLTGQRTTSGIITQLQILEEELKRTSDGRLVPIINNQVEALKKLSDSTSRVSDLFQQLSEIESRRQAKINLAAGFFGADIKGRMDMTRDIGMTSTFIGGGGDGKMLEKLPIQIQQAIMRGLSLLESSTFRGSGGKTGAEHRTRLMEGFLGGAIAPETKARDAKRGEIINIMMDAEKAADMLAVRQTAIYNEHYRNLTDINKKFLIGLSSIMKPFTTLSTVMAELPKKMTWDHNFKGEVAVVINGSTILTSILPEVAKIVENRVKLALGDYSKRYLPDINYTG